MRRLLFSLSFCAVAWAQSYVWNPFTKRLDKVGGTGGGGGSGVSFIQEDGTNLPQQSILNFVGTGITCGDNPGSNSTDCTVPAAIQTIFDEGTALANRNALNFIGSVVSCVDNAGLARTDCTITGSGGGGGLNSLTGSAGIVTGGTLTDPTIAFGWAHTGTVSTPTYTVVGTDNGTVKRFAGANQVDVSLPLFTYPFHFMAFNDGQQPVVFTVTAGDINGDATLVLQQQEGALLSLGASSVFWRGITVTGRVASGAGVPAANRCDSANEAGKVYVRTDSAATGSSLFVCANTAAATYAWEGPFDPAGGGGGGGPVSVGNVADFKPSIAASTVTIAPGTIAFNGFKCAGIATGSVTFTAGSGDAKQYIDSQCNMVTVATTGITASITGVMVYQNATTPSFPDTAFPIADLTVSAAVPTLDDDARAMFKGAPYLAGTNIITSSANGTITFDTNPATIPTLGGANVWTGTNSFTSPIPPTTSSGPPSAANCASDSALGGEVTDISVGGAKYRCEKILDTSGTDHYLFLPVGISPTAGCLSEPFLLGSVNTTTSGNTGVLNTALQNLAGTSSSTSIASESGRWGIRSAVSGTVDNDKAGLAFIQSNNVNLIPDLSSGGIGSKWFYQARFRIPTGESIADRVLFVGVGNAADVATSRTGLTYDTDSTHSTFHIMTCNAGTCTGTDSDTTVAPAANTWTLFTQWSTTQGTILGALNNAAPVTHSANGPTTGGSPTVVSGARVGGTAKGVQVDFMRFCWWGHTL